MFTHRWRPIYKTRERISQSVATVQDIVGKGLLRYVEEARKMFLMMLRCAAVMLAAQCVVTEHAFDTVMHGGCNPMFGSDSESPNFQVLL